MGCLIWARVTSCVESSTQTPKVGSHASRLVRPSFTPRACSRLARCYLCAVSANREPPHSGSGAGPDIHGGLLPCVLSAGEDHSHWRYGGETHSRPGPTEPAPQLRPTDARPAARPAHLAFPALLTSRAHILNFSTRVSPTPNPKFPTNVARWPHQTLSQPHSAPTRRPALAPGVACLRRPLPIPGKHPPRAHRLLPGPATPGTPGL